MQAYYEDNWVKVYHGDCRDVIPTLSKVDIVLTDMPFAAETHSGARTGSGDRMLIDFDHITAEQAIEYFGLCRSICGNWIISFLDWRHMLPLEQQTQFDLELVRFGVWVKPNGMPQYSGDRPATGWEGIAFTHPKGKKVWNGGGRTSVFTHNFEQNGRVHSTQKPLGLMKQLVNLFSQPNDLILDPFAGSFTTIRAAKDLGRRAIGIETNERHCEEAARRMSQDVLWSVTQEELITV